MVLLQSSKIAIVAIQKKTPTFKLGDACHLLKSEYTQYENKSRVSSLSMSVRIFAEFIYE